MTAGRRVMVWVSMVLGGVALIGLGAFFVAVGLEQADKLGSVIGAFVGLVGLALSGYGLILVRRGPMRPSGQTVSGSVVGGEVLQVRGVGGNLRIASSAVSTQPRAPDPVLPPSEPLAPVGRASDQSVTAASVSGPVRQIDGIAGDVDTTDKPVVPATDPPKNRP